MGILPSGIICSLQRLPSSGRSFVEEFFSTVPADRYRLMWQRKMKGIYQLNYQVVTVNSFVTSLLIYFLFRLINGDFAAAAVLITFGAVLGVTSPFQLVVICIIEVFLYALNEFIGAELLKVSWFTSVINESIKKSINQLLILQAIDVGGSMFIHTFGAYFGLSMSLVMRKNAECESSKEGATNTSDLFAMIGTNKLYWKSVQLVWILSSSIIFN